MDGLCSSCFCPSSKPMTFGGLDGSPICGTCFRRTLKRLGKFVRRVAAQFQSMDAAVEATARAVGSWRVQIDDEGR